MSIDLYRYPSNPLASSQVLTMARANDYRRQGVTSSEIPHLFQPLNLPMVIRARPNRLWASVYGVSAGNRSRSIPFVKLRPVASFFRWKNIF